MARLMAKDYVQVQKHAPVVVAPVQHVVMRLSVASHKGKLSPASWAIRGPLLPPHHAGVGATKLPSGYSPMEASILAVLALGAPF